MNGLSKIIDRKDIFTEYLTVLNGILKLTDKQILVLAKIIELAKDNVLSTEVRKDICIDLQMSDANLRKCLVTLKKKKYIYLNNDLVTINKLLIPIIVDNAITIDIVFNIKNNE